MTIIAVLYGYALAYLVAPTTFDSTHVIEFVAGLPDAVKYAGKTILAAPFAFHSWNGLRHLSWDMGKCMSPFPNPAVSNFDTLAFPSVCLLAFRSLVSQGSLSICVCGLGCLCSNDYCPRFDVDGALHVVKSVRWKHLYDNLPNLPYALYTQHDTCGVHLGCCTPVNMVPYYRVCHFFWLKSSERE